MLKRFLFQWVMVSCLVMGVAQAAQKAPIMDVGQLYTKHCSICHGDNGDGNSRARGGMDPKPRDFTSPQAAMELTRKRMINSVTHGRPGTAMMAHEGRLSTEQIAALVDYIREKFMRTPTAQLEEEEKKGGHHMTTPALNSPILITGERIYTANCSVCHGDKGNTAFWAKNGLNPPPRNFTGQEALSTLTKARMIHSVTHGRPGTGMMPFNKRLSGDEIKAVVSFIRAKFMGVDFASDTGEAPLDQMEGHTKQVAKAHQAAAEKQSTESKPASSPTPHAGGIPGIDTPMPSTSQPSAPHGGDHSGMPVLGMGASSPGHVIDADMSLPIPNDLQGDAAWGRKFYMNNCFTCHGVKGDGQGPRAYFNIPRPRNFTSEASRRILNRPRVFEGITKGRVGTVMPAWGKVLTPQQVANLTEYVFTTYIHPESESKDEKKKAR
jgi:mono/diheme cytochrome c family protein